MSAYGTPAVILMYVIYLAIFTATILHSKRRTAPVIMAAVCLAAIGPVLLVVRCILPMLHAVRDSLEGRPKRNA